MVAGVLAWAPGCGCARPMSARRCAPPPRMPTSPRPTASTTRSSPICCPAWARPTPAIAGTFIALIATLAPAQIWAWLGVVFAVVIIGRLGNPLGALLAGMLIGVSESIAMAVVDAGLGAARVVLGADRHPAVGSGMAVNAARDLPKAAAAAAIVALAFLPMAKMPAFYESFLYLIFFWVALATSWALLSGFAGYFSFGHAAFFGVGIYTTAALTTKFGVPVPRHRAGRRRAGGAAGGRHRRRGVPPAPAARRAVRAAHPGRHLRASPPSSSTRRSTAAAACS